jgi:hypothetical protein
LGASLFDVEGVAVREVLDVPDPRRDYVSTIGEEVDKHGVSEAYIAIAEALIRRGLTPIKGRVVTETFGPWVVCVNGTDKPVDVEPTGSMGCKALPPVHAALFYNGWLAGEINPAGGWIAAHPEGANERTFIEALKP